jgi:hypothetical protein
MTDAVNDNFNKLPKEFKILFLTSDENKVTEI